MRLIDTYKRIRIIPVSIGAYLLCVSASALFSTSSIAWQYFNEVIAKVFVMLSLVFSRIKIKDNIDCFFIDFAVFQSVGILFYLNFDKWVAIDWLSQDVLNYFIIFISAILALLLMWNRLRRELL